MRIKAIALLAAAVLLATPLAASGPVGIYGIVEKVVFEPDEAGSERVQVWGAFAYAETSTGGWRTSKVARGYLYFRAPSPAALAALRETADNVRREWADLKAVAGTGQVVAFGSWGYIGGFDALDPGVGSATPPYVLEWAPQGGAKTDLRVRPASEPPASPAMYQTNAGVVRLTEQGSHAELVRTLRDAIR